MKESYREGVASHSGPEPCEGGGNVALEALDREVGSPKPLIGTSLDGGSYRECALWAWQRQCGAQRLPSAIGVPFNTHKPSSQAAV